MQEKVCREYAKRCGYEVLKVFVEKGESAKTIERTKLKELQAKKDRIDELMIKGVFDDATYKQKAEEVNNEVMAKNIELSEARIELNDIEACLNYCKFVMSNIASLWVNADLNLKQRFQTIVFPDKIYYEGETFRTTATALIFKQLQ